MFYMQAGVCVSNLIICISLRSDKVEYRSLTLNMRGHVRTDCASQLVTSPACLFVIIFHDRIMRTHNQHDASRTTLLKPMWFA